MTRTIADFYRGPVVWVEDAPTREILTHQWGNVSLDVVVANGKRAVRELVAAAPLKQQPIVYGVVDRDFDNHDEHWHAPAGRIFTLPVHEAENLLLDFDALSHLASGESAGALEERALGFAKSGLWWMACRAVLRRLASYTITGDGEPALDGPDAIRDQPDALRFLLGQRLDAKLEEARRDVASRSAIETRLAERHAFYEGSLRTGQWRNVFSGKEIFRHLRMSTPGLDGSPRTKALGPNVRDLELAKRVLRHLREAGREIPDVIRLKDSLLRRLPTQGS